MILEKKMNNYHIMSIEDTLKKLDSSFDGLSKNQASERLEKDGLNALKEGKKNTLFHKIISQFKDVMIIVLLVAALISGLLGEITDALIILAIVILNAVMGIIQESKAEKALEALKSLSKPYTTVIRDKQIIKVKSEEIVTGDIIILEAGDYVPADLRLIESNSLKIQESSLTGESVSVEKVITTLTDSSLVIGDRKNMAFSSSVVTYGRGKGVVVATGMETEVGKIASYITDDNLSSETPLSKQLNKTGKILSVIVIIAAVIILVTGLIQGRAFIEMFLISVSIAVAAIPEGLPAIVTVVLALGVQKMSSKNAIVRKLPAVETLGSTEIICSDKTGTLTLNQMTVKELYFINNTPSADDMRIFMYIMMLCNDTKISMVEGKEKLVGDPTETALVAFAKSYGHDKNKLEEQFLRVSEIPFDSERKLMTTINKMDGKYKALVKGAPDILISKCTHILENGNVRAITEDDIRKLHLANSTMASKALRVLAFAYREYIKLPEKMESEIIENELIFVGLEGMIDPPREEVKEAIKICKTAGMRAVMITGDHQDTATAIARQLGILNEKELAISGSDLDKMTDDNLYEQVKYISVYARVSPEHKVRIVNAWKKHGKIVAMTGDGVNDAPSLKAADIGIGMGITGTDVAKSVSDMILADDNFATIIIAVEEGRRTYANIEKAIQFLLSANTAEVLTLFVATFLSWKFLFPIHILWINLITDSFPALALGMEKPESDLMSRPPRESKKSLFSGRLGKNIIIQGFLQAALTLGVYSYAITHFNVAVSITMAFLTLGLIQLFHVFNIRAMNKSIFKSKFFSNRYVFVAVFFSAVLQVGVVLIPKLNEIFRTVPLTGEQWIIVLAASFTIIPLVEITKLILKLFKTK
ncbi:MAG: calcium-translocating P-type ATPase, PMCA-type [Clostridia bacterium]|nr:calcium-translocating P-type ATPase, PMCA-type [Clostridia bacterium]